MQGLFVWLFCLTCGRLQVQAVSVLLSFPFNFLFSFSFQFFSSGFLL